MNSINDRKYLGFMVLQDIEAGNQVDRILKTAGFCIAITISVNFKLSSNEQELVCPSYSARPVQERIILMTESNPNNSGKMIQTGTGTILAVQQKADHTANFNELEFLKGYIEEIILAKNNFFAESFQIPLSQGSRSQRTTGIENNFRKSNLLQLES